MKRYIFTVLLLFIVFSCKEKNTSVETEKATFTIAKSEYTILPFSENKVYIFKDAKEATLSDKELTLIEELFKELRKDHNAMQTKWLEKHNKENPENTWKKTGYELETKGFKRQYLPIINSKGEKEVWINLFCNHFEDMNWKEGRIHVFDGGNCYYNFKINLVTKEIYELRINGYA